MPTLHVATSRRASRKVPVPTTPAVGNAEGDIASKTQVLSAIVQTVDPDARQMMIAEAARSSPNTTISLMGSKW